MKGKVKVIVDGVTYEVEVEELGTGKFRVSFEGESYEVEAKDLGIPLSAMEMPAQVQAPSVSAPAPSAPSVVPVSTPVAPSTPTSVSVGGNVVSAPMPGKVLRILVSEGEKVKTGQGLLVLEAMKMENEIPAPKDGIVKKILIKEGDTVDTNQPLIEIG
ncbi:acetyl-CoA carboxylase biotin carboxyl carrier protein subunit [Thermococcus sp. SY098]|uniref:acetyl-CoA carboxylase biotin carboxyl carrier protein subunit n=1 Tax=Thermococcus sp. SY098 TaxID=3111325 RepID=UPI002D7943CD|nr:acetyl-CoA carboxylase biotin carboxyl carrier protein subunit [Thermococcus sp. SY098]WRS53803.1 acetyl-CoA carboxylase biotin carboxyl carrier protein subunit [Thermococcus sp. SY098]